MMELGLLLISLVRKTKRIDIVLIFLFGEAGGSHDRAARLS